MEVWSHYWSLGCVGFDPAVREMLVMVSEPIGNLLDHPSSYILLLLSPPSQQLKLLQVYGHPANLGVGVRILSSSNL